MVVFMINNGSSKTISYVQNNDEPVNVIYLRALELLYTALHFGHIFNFYFCY